jgi:hypothetical protein
MRAKGARGLTTRFCERRLRMRYVAMLALLAFLAVPLVGCKKAEEPAPPVEKPSAEKATDLLNKAAEEAGKAAEEAGKAAPEAVKKAAPEAAKDVEK